MQYKPDLFVLCAYKLKLQHVLQLSPVYEKTAKIYCADILLCITCVKSYIKTLSPNQQILFSSRLTMYLCVSIIIHPVRAAHSLFIRVFSRFIVFDHENRMKISVTSDGATRRTKLTTVKCLI